MKHSTALIGISLIVAGCALRPDPVPRAPQPTAQAVVFDIDGTLTSDVLSVYSVRPEAAKAAHLYAMKGYSIIYLSARITLLQSGLPGWLKKHDFPEGTVHVTETKADRKDHGVFKARILREYVEQGWNLAYAYGDSSSDFEAYAAAGIPQNKIYALLRTGDEQCQSGTWKSCLVNWDEHLEFIQNTPAVK